MTSVLLVTRRSVRDRGFRRAGSAALRLTPGLAVLGVQLRDGADALLRHGTRVAVPRSGAIVVGATRNLGGTVEHGPNGVARHLRQAPRNADTTNGLDS